MRTMAIIYIIIAVVVFLLVRTPANDAEDHQENFLRFLVSFVWPLGIPLMIYLTYKTSVGVSVLHFP